MEFEGLFVGNQETQTLMERIRTLEEKVQKDDGYRRKQKERDEERDLTWEMDLDLTLLKKELRRTDRRRYRVCVRHLLNALIEKVYFDLEDGLDQGEKFQGGKILVGDLELDLALGHGTGNGNGNGHGNLSEPEQEQEQWSSGWELAGKNIAEKYLKSHSLQKRSKYEMRSRMNTQKNLQNY
ncbi:MAG: hypothetical protein M1823_000489 [Watsoniomyces obsoletus]|nr:MAG: hypothetical protein M1823_000489 [Watsoniomyces obsoletus]